MKSPIPSQRQLFDEARGLNINACSVYGGRGRSRFAHGDESIYRRTRVESFQKSLGHEADQSHVTAVLTPLELGLGRYSTAILLVALFTEVSINHLMIPHTDGDNGIVMPGPGAMNPDDEFHSTQALTGESGKFSTVTTPSFFSTA